MTVSMRSMKALLQRVRHASVTVDEQVIGKIDHGVVIFLGVEKLDTEVIATRLAKRILDYRVFADSSNRMNLNVKQVEGGVLVVSQFTLVADTRSGTRPGFSHAAAPQLAQKLYMHFLEQLGQHHGPIQSGKFAADMQVSLLNDGPVTFMLD